MNKPDYMMPYYSCYNIQAPYEHDAAKEYKTFRYLNIEECKEVDEAYYFGNDGQVHKCRRNGKNKVWKTRPNDLVIPMKYGLSHYFKVQWVDGNMLFPRLVKEVE